MVDQPFYVKLGIWIINSAPAIAGSIVSLKFGTDNQTWFNKLTTLFAGIIIAHYVGWSIVQYLNFEVESLASSTTLFVTGLFGVTIFSEASKQIPEIIKGVSEGIRDLVKRKLG